MPSTPLRWARPVLAGLIVLLVSSLGAAQLRAADAHERDVEVARAAPELVVAVESAGRDLVAAAADVADRISSDTQLAEIAGLARSVIHRDQVASFVPAESGAAAASDLSGFGPDSAVVAAALAQVRDTGVAGLGPPIAGELVSFAPLYSRSNGDLRRTPDSVATVQRRAVLVGWVAVRGPFTAESVAPSSDDPSIRVTVTDDDVELIDSGALHHATTTQLRVAGRVWTVEVGATRSTVVPTVSTLVVALGVLLAVLAAAVVARADRRSASLRERSERAEHQFEVIAGVVPVIRESSDLATVLPMLSTAMFDQLGVSGLAVDLADQGERAGAGAEIDLGSGTQYLPVFVDGIAPDGNGRELSAGGRLGDVAIAPNETLIIPLLRGGRVQGRMRIRTSTEHQPEDAGVVLIAAELMSAVVSSAMVARQQQEAIDHLRELDRVKSVFLETAAHELRTPVTALNGFATVIRKGWKDLPEEQVDQFLDRMTANTQTLMAHLRDLLDNSRMERGSKALSPVTVDLATWLRDFAVGVNATIPDHTLVAEVDDHLHVLADPAALDRIVTNLVSNAGRYAPPGTTIRISTATDSEHASLIVDDEGPGVPESERELIFSRFYRGHADTVVRTKGLGIGLAIVADLVDRMGGSVEVGESPSGGARFVVRLELDEMQGR